MEERGCHRHARGGLCRGGRFHTGREIPGASVELPGIVRGKPHGNGKEAGPLPKTSSLSRGTETVRNNEGLPVPKFCRGFCAAVIAAVGMLSPFSASALDTAFWVWQRSEPLSDAERTELSAQGVRTIYWQVGELENVGETWRWKARFAMPPSNGIELRVVPIVRLESRERSPFSQTSLESLLGALA